MTHLTQQLEDKKKELMNGITCPYCNKVLILYNGNRLKCLNNKCKGEIKDFPKDVIGDAILKAEITILEQAIAEMQKQRQEILEKIESILEGYSNHWSLYNGNDIISLKSVFKDIEKQLQSLNPEGDENE